MNRIIECVPNFSEGRNAATIDALVTAIEAIPHVRVLHRTSDHDHNRSVITFAGEPEPVAEGAIRVVGKAAELIDLTTHTGVHPRIGATDVVPFVPVRDTSLEDCRKIAHSVGQEIWSRYKIPVYFYEAAALSRKRKNLENIRRGQFEFLQEEALTNPAKAPDIGGPAFHPTAGATIVGARNFLIAYNINLNTAELSVAKRIAQKIRASSGGLPCVKAMGVMLATRNIAQVSMNLTDFKTTSMR